MHPCSKVRVLLPALKILLLILNSCTPLVEYYLYLAFSDFLSIEYAYDT